MYTGDDRVVARGVYVDNNALSGTSIVVCNLAMCSKFQVSKCKTLRPRGPAPKTEFSHWWGLMEVAVVPELYGTGEWTIAKQTKPTTAQLAANHNLS